jgi:hypothetical protein
MHDKVIEYLMNDKTRLIDDIRARRDVGLARYGTTLQANNGRKALLDMYQELLDALVYAEQYKTEGGRAGGHFFNQLVNICSAAREIITSTCGDVE